MIIRNKFHILTLNAKALIYSAFFLVVPHHSATALSLLPCETSFDKIFHESEAIFLGKFKKVKPTSDTYDGIVIFEPTKIWRGGFSGATEVNVAYIIPDYLNEKDKQNYLQRFDIDAEYLLMIKKHALTNDGKLVMVPYICRSLFPKQTWHGENKLIDDIEHYFKTEKGTSHDD